MKLLIALFLQTILWQSTAIALEKDNLNIKHVNVTHATCHRQANGRATLEVEGGRKPYYYSLDGFSFQSEASFQHLKAGNYNFFVEDADGKSITGSFIINQPDKIEFTEPKITYSSCCNPNGAVLANAKGGTGIIEYQLDGGPYVGLGYFQELSGGYTITAKDSLGCKAFTVVVVPDFGGPQIDFINATDVSCYHGSNGSIDVIAIGGVGRLKYSIDGKTYKTENNFSNLKAGKYLVKVKDEVGCTDSLVLVIDQPEELEMAVTSYVMHNGEPAIEINYSIGGTGTHTYSLNGKEFQAESSFTSLAPGNYSVIVKDAAGCTLTKRITCTRPYYVKNDH